MRRDEDEHYLKRELYGLFRNDSHIFDFLQQGSLDGVWYWDLESPEDEWMSPEFWATLGYDAAEMRHKASEWQHLIDPEDLEVAQANFRMHCEDPRHPYDQIVRYRHRNGSTVWVRCRGMAIRNDQGKPVRMLGAHTDISPLKRTEEELRQRTDQLEAKNRELTDALNRVIDGCLPVCSYCRRIRDETERWHPLEVFVTRKSGAQVTHGICPDCVPMARSGADTDS